MRADYLDHMALEDNASVVYLIVRVPDGRILLQKNESTRLVPRIPSDWQCTLSKRMHRGQRNDSALKTLVFSTFAWPEKIIDDVQLLMRFGLNKKTIFIYYLVLTETTFIQPGAGSKLKALPWSEVVQLVYSKEKQFSDETYSVVDLIHNHNGGRF